MNSRLTQISKEVSYALRHAPEEYGFELDAEGFASIDALLTAINTRHPGRQPVTRDDLEEIIATSDKHRHEIVGNHIRALYGHSISMTIERPPSTPPNILYHGTTHKALSSIMEDGLRRMRRQRVHLSTDVEMATSVGNRRDRNPVILQVDAAAAHADGIVFYKGNDRIWLAESVPSQYLTVLNT